MEELLAGEICGVRAAFRSSHDYRDFGPAPNSLFHTVGVSPTDVDLVHRCARRVVEADTKPTKMARSGMALQAMAWVVSLVTVLQPYTPIQT